MEFTLTVTVNTGGVDLAEWPVARIKEDVSCAVIERISDYRYTPAPSVVVSDDHTEESITELRNALWQIVNWSNSNPIAPPLAMRRSALATLRKYAPPEGNNEALP